MPQEERAGGSWIGQGGEREVLEGAVRGDEEALAGDLPGCGPEEDAAEWFGRVVVGGSRALARKPRRGRTDERLQGSQAGRTLSTASAVTTQR